MIAVVPVLCGIVIIIAAVSLGVVVIVMCASKSLADHSSYVHVNTHLVLHV